jgi:hypothetical protein
MTDAQFRSEIEIKEYLAMLPGYPSGDFKRNPKNFQPLAILQENSDGTLNRAAILDDRWEFTAEERAKLLEVTV